jgi:hypothetical protein
MNTHDIKQIQHQGQTQEAVERQINNFIHGFPPVHLIQAATVENHGIQRFSTEQIIRLAKDFDLYALHSKIVLFVPASGAASRMFKSLFAFLNDQQEKQDVEIQEFIENIRQFAFYENLEDAFKKSGKNIEQASAKDKIAYLLEKKGLNYGNLPKGLLHFHRYADGNRFAVEEHLVEGANYGKSADNKVFIHFTVSPEHQDDFVKTLKHVTKKYEAVFAVDFKIGFSQQKASTDTIAVNLDNTPFRNADGSLLFRPAGHGALIENLNDIDADIIFIKNIDNVVPDHLKSETILYKKALGGLLICITDEIKRLLHILQHHPQKGIEEATTFIEKTLYLRLSEMFEAWSKSEKVSFLKQFLARPVRICGMVKNEGEPGGGPFFVGDADGNINLQIVESSQIDMKNEQQFAIAKSATHFNPVDLVCGVKDHEGNPFDLRQFVDPKTGFISEKSKDGKPLKAQELPGLWNGAMAKWITLFVETPLITFNPVKTANDLLRKEHQD